MTADDLILDHARSLANALADAGAPSVNISAAFIAVGATEALSAGRGLELADHLRALAARIEAGDVATLAPVGSA